MWNCHGKSSIQNGEQSFHQQIGIKFKEEIIKWYIWSTALCGAENWTFMKVDQKYLESFEMWCWRGVDGGTVRVINEEMLHSQEERNILYTVQGGRLNGLVTSCVGTAF